MTDGRPVTDRPPFTLRDVKESTSRNLAAIERMRAAAHRCSMDTDNVARREEQLCRLCFYHRKGGIVTHGFRNWACDVCFNGASHPNSDVPRVCAPCADRLRLCMKCGADVHLAPREALEPPPDGTPPT